MNETGILTGFSDERTAARGLISRIILSETFVVHTGTEIISDQHMVRDNAADRITGQLKFIAVLSKKKADIFLRCSDRSANGKRNGSQIIGSLVQDFDGRLIILMTVHII